MTRRTAREDMWHHPGQESDAKRTRRVKLSQIRMERREKKRQITDEERELLLARDHDLSTRSSDRSVQVSE